jgi:hypothetical protein
VQGIEQGLQLIGRGGKQGEVVGIKQQPDQLGAKLHPGLRQSFCKPALETIYEQTKQQGDSGSPA